MLPGRRLAPFHMSFNASPPPLNASGRTLTPLLYPLTPRRRALTPPHCPLMT